ncbi:MAG: hypothetical protein U0359_16585 [Byssovorax sp.]
MKRRWFALAVVTSLALGGAPRLALAQPAPEAKAAAEALFDEGRRLKADGKYPEACPKFEESQKLAPGMGTLYNLSDCYEHIGRTASAWAGFREVAALAGAAGQAEREKDARGRISALEPKLIRLKVTVQKDGAPPGIEVKRDGAVMSPGVWGTAIPIDPGRHQVTAIAPGKRPWERMVDLQQAGETVTVEVPPLLDAGPSAPPPGPPGPGPRPAGTITAPPPPPVTPPDLPPAKRPWQLPLGIGLTGLGAVGLGLGTAFGFMAKSTFDDSASHCNDKNQCDPDGLHSRSDAVAEGNMATGVFIAGAVVAAGGVALWITAPSAPKAASSSAVPRPLAISIGPGRMGLEGAF